MQRNSFSLKIGCGCVEEGTCVCGMGQQRQFTLSRKQLGREMSRVIHSDSDPRSNSQKYNLRNNQKEEKIFVLQR